MFATQMRKSRIDWIGRGLTCCVCMKARFYYFSSRTRRRVLGKAVYEYFGYKMTLKIDKYL